MAIIYLAAHAINLYSSTHSTLWVLWLHDLHCHPLVSATTSFGLYHCNSLTDCPASALVPTIYCQHTSLLKHKSEYFCSKQFHFIQSKNQSSLASYKTLPNCVTGCLVCCPTFYCFTLVSPTPAMLVCKPFAIPPPLPEHTCPNHLPSAPLFSFSSNLLQMSLTQWALLWR